MDINIDATPESQIFIFDSSFLIALLSQADSLHQHAKRQIHLLEHLRVLPDFIVSETATVLRNKVSYEESIAFVEQYTNTQNVYVQTFPMEFKSFCDEFVNPENKNLSFVDASLLALHKTGKYRVVTFDKNLKKLIEKFNKTKKANK